MNTRTVAICSQDGGEQLLFAVNPGEISLSRPNRNRVFDLALGGSVNLWGGRGLRQVRLSTFLPHGDSPFFAGVTPEEALARLRRWQDSGDPVRLIVSNSDVNDTFLIEDVTQIYREGDRDVGLEVALREFKPLSAAPGSGDGTAQRPDERPAQTTYTVVKGDTLWEIACRFYGDGTRWRELARRNGVADPRKLPIGKVLVL